MNESYVFLAEGFEEVEALTSVDVLRRAGMPVTTVSISDSREVLGAHGVPVVADAIIDDIDLLGAEWLILPGGMPGASNLKACEPLCDALVERNAQGKGIAAICASPSVVLGQLGLLKGRNAVCYPGMESIGMAGAKLSTAHAVTDGNIITGKGPASAARFALAIVTATCGQPVADEVARGMLLK